MKRKTAQILSTEDVKNLKEMISKYSCISSTNIVVTEVKRFKQHCVGMVKAKYSQSIFLQTTKRNTVLKSESWPILEILFAALKTLTYLYVLSIRSI
jgi:hypothetical protein